MAFKLNEFIKRGLIDAVGHLADYQVILNATGWLEKGVLTENDLMDIQKAIDKQYVSLSTATVSEVATENVADDKADVEKTKKQSKKADIEIEKE